GVSGRSGAGGGEGTGRGADWGTPGASTLFAGSLSTSDASWRRRPRLAFWSADGRVPSLTAAEGCTFNLPNPPGLAHASSECRRWLSEIEKPPRPDATPSSTPSVCRTERPSCSRISDHAAC